MSVCLSVYLSIYLSIYNIYRLYLSGNLLSTIDWDTLPDFHYLTTLGLYSNQVTCIGTTYLLHS